MGGSNIWILFLLEISGLMRHPEFNDKEEKWLNYGFDTFLEYIDGKQEFKDKIMRGLFLNTTMFADSIVVRNKLKGNNRHTHQ